MKRVFSALLAALCLAAATATVHAAPLQAVNPQWSEEKQQVKAPAWNMTAEAIAAAYEGKDLALAGYDYLYVGHGEDSLYGADWNLSEQVGAWRYGTGTAQFQLTDPAKAGSVYTAYCADIDTTSKTGWWYKVENLEDAAYYARGDAADHIRAIALTGYWGTAAGTGSLGAVKDALCAAIDGGTLTTMTKEDVAALTEGEALTATQMAIWKYGNPYEVITLGANTLDRGSPYWDYCDEVLKAQYGMDDAAIDDALARIEAVAAYLMGLTITAEGAGETTILRDGELVKEANLRVGQKVGEGLYRADLLFTLQVAPQQGDDVTVQLLGADGAVLAQGRIAPAEEEGVLLPDSAGCYTLGGLTLKAGEEMACRFTLTGVQQLRRGVYVYTSEVREGVSSQTFVGLAEGAVQVNGQQALPLSFAAPADPVPSVPYVPSVPTVTVESPKTGDGVLLWAVLGAVSSAAMGVVGWRKRG
ncbi:MAG: thioester domain-containing protein [Oscillospiraceae bacterium]|nr:thioester domain-containing protein [Oscillospiraceae bacterium]